MRLLEDQPLPGKASRALARQRMRLAPVVDVSQKKAAREMRRRYRTHELRGVVVVPPQRRVPSVDVCANRAKRKAVLHAIGKVTRPGGARGGSRWGPRCK